MASTINIFWFRRDLRLDDNPGLYHALKSGNPILLLFIFDTDILNDLENKSDPRVMFIHDELTRIHDKVKKHKSGLLVKHGKPIEIFRKITEEFNIEEVYSNRDYEPYGIKRDREIESFLSDKDINFFQFRDHVIYEKEEIVNQGGDPYKVFTPYKNKWLDVFKEDRIENFPSEKNLHNLFTDAPEKILSLKKTGFTRSSIEIPAQKIDLDTIRKYEKTRDYPAQEGTSRLGIHLRHGTISIRKAIKIGLENNKTWLNELIWREFYIMILYNFPRVINTSFHEKYDKVPWQNDEALFKKWCDGKTGYPIVDAGMRQLNQTGYMHNRVRMITASFLTKHLLIDWRWGEAYFAKKLLDYELASNNGGWQWAAGTGTDAQPYFRVFNPSSQADKYDPEEKYIKRWVPEYNSENYSKPIVDHKFARNRAIETYKKAIN